MSDNKLKGFTTLTPIEHRDNLFFKRDDLFMPFADSNVNGTKLRECWMLLNDLDWNNYSGVITGCNLISPQAPIVTAVCRELQLPVTVVYGGTNIKSAMKVTAPKVCKQLGATLDLSPRCGYNSALNRYIQDLACAQNLFQVKYGVDIFKAPLLLKAVGEQVLNIPKEVTELHLVCGSGITCIGILLGLEYYSIDHIKRIVLYQNAPNRMQKIHNYFSLLHPNKFIKRIELVPLFTSPDFSYTKREKCSAYGIEFHPNYEAKALNYMLNNLNFTEHKTLFWIIGQEIKYKEA